MSTDGIPLISTRMEGLGMCQKGRPMLASRPSRGLRIRLETSLRTCRDADPDRLGSTMGCDRQCCGTGTCRVWGGQGPPRERTGVTIANALGGEFRNLSNFRVWADALKRKALERGLPEGEGDAFVASIVEGSPRIDEDTMPGELANVVAGRVANLLDLQGPNHTTDAACASSMAALLDACLQLQAGFVDVMLVGATDRRSILRPSRFSAIGASLPRIPHRSMRVRMDS